MLRADCATSENTTVVGDSVEWRQYKFADSNVLVGPEYTTFSRDFGCPNKPKVYGVYHPDQKWKSNLKRVGSKGKEEPIYPLKIGYTKKETVEERIKNAYTTEFMVVFWYCTSEPRELENYIFKKLRELNRKQNVELPRDEWYLTNVEELLYLCNSFADQFEDTSWRWPGHSIVCVSGIDNEVALKYKGLFEP